MAGCITPWTSRRTRARQRNTCGRRSTCPISPARSSPIARPARCCAAGTAPLQPGTTNHGHPTERMSRNAVETVMGAVVLVVAALFLFFAYTRTQTHTVTGYEVSARFDRVDGLRTGGDVRISGIKVGTVTSQSLDAQTFLAVVHLTIDPSIKLPVDTIATITSTGLLGENYLALVPGNDEEFIKPGGAIDHTEPPINIFSLINKFVGSGGGAPSPQKKDGDSAPAK